MTIRKDPCKVITEPCRSTMMFVNQLSDTDKDGKDQAPQCSTGILIPKKNKKTIAAIEAAIDVACKKKGINNPGKATRKFWYPLQDCMEAIEAGDFEPDDPSIYEGMYYLKAKAYKLPGVVDKGNNELDPEDRIEVCVSGYWFRFSLIFKAFSNEMDGVWVQLNNMMFYKEDARLDGGASATSEFEEFADDDDDDDDDDEVEEQPRRTRRARRSRR